ncbi:MAG: divalent cation tolerance protein CutA [Desulfovibrio sp.]|nr:divalent cation tolerance protein CutA [Desulfovibrio sp.]
MDYCKLEIFIPESHFRDLQQTLRQVDAGHLGNYDSCLSYSRVMGTWRPLEHTSPYIGTIGEVSEEPELKVEVTCRRDKLAETIAAIKRIHPYEEPVINALPLIQTAQ